MSGPPISSQQAQLLQILLRALNTPVAEEPALLSRAVDILSNHAAQRRGGDATTLDTVAGAMEAALALHPERVARLHVLRRRLAFAGQVGSGMAAYNFKPELMQLFLALQRAQPQQPPAALFSGSGQPAALQPGHAPRAQQQPVSVELLAAAGVLPPWVEAALVHDLVFVLQGVDGAHVRLDADADAFVVSSVVDGFALSAGVRGVVGCIAEVGWMHRRILRSLPLGLPPPADADIVSSSGGGGGVNAGAAEAGGGGLVRRAFVAAVRAELGDYYRLLAELDASTATTATSAHRGTSEAAAGVGTSTASPWTLRRLLVWAAEPLLRMRCLAALVDACAGLSGAALASEVHLHHVRGDPSTRELIGRILGRVCKPLVAMCLQWMATGRVPATEAAAAAPLASDAGGATADPAVTTAAEFFVRVASGRTAVEDIWEHRFSVDPGAVPLFWSATTAAGVLSVGKSVHFMLAACSDGAWVARHVQPAIDAVRAMMVAAAEAAALGNSGAASRRSRAAAAAVSAPGSAAVPESLALAQTTLATLEGPDVTGARLLESSLAALAPLVDARLAELLLGGEGGGGHRLGAHLLAIQRYVLLGQGDFVSVFLSAVSAELDRPAAAVALALPALDGALEAAIRASNAQHDDKDTLARISCRLLTPSPGDTGWDIFTLHYAMTPPLSAVVTPAASDAYARLFYFLWRVRRVEHALSGTWTAHMAAAHGVRALGHAGLTRVLHACHLLRAELTSFVTTLISYLMFEVVAAAWQGLQERLADARSLGEILAAHNAYLDTLLDRALLSPRTALVAAPLGELLSVALAFADLHEGLVAAAAAQVDVRREHEVTMAQRSAAGEWGASDADDAVHARIGTALDAAVARFAPGVSELVAAARGGMMALLAAIDAASLEDGSEQLRMLVVRFDFNGFYEARP